MSTAESLNGYPGGNEIGAPAEIEAIQLPTGELLDVSAVAAGGVDRVLRGYLEMAKIMNPHDVAELYKKFKPDSDYDGHWFERNRYVA